jgi:hypothetical protein
MSLRLRSQAPPQDGDVPMLGAGRDTAPTQTGDAATDTSLSGNADDNGHKECGDEREGGDGRNGIDDDDGNSDGDGSDSNSDGDGDSNSDGDEDDDGNSDGDGSDSNSDSDGDSNGDGDEDDDNDDGYVTDAGNIAVTDNTGGPATAPRAESTASSGNDTTMLDDNPATGAAAETAGNDSSRVDGSGNDTTMLDDNPATGAAAETAGNDSSRDDGSGNDTTMLNADSATGAVAETSGDDSSSDRGSDRNGDDTEANDSLDEGHCRVLVCTAGTDDAANSGGEQSGPEKALAHVSGNCLLIPRGKQAASFAGGLVTAWGSC